MAGALRFTMAKKPVQLRRVIQHLVTIEVRSQQHRQPNLTVCVTGRIARFIHIRLCMGTPGSGDL